MKEYSADLIRNIGFIAHAEVGKTSLAEAILFAAGETTRLGSVEEGNTISDCGPDEIKRKISISTSLLHCEWKKHKINLLDTPGYSDFIGEVKGALRVVDTGLVLLSGLTGVEVMTEQVWGFAKEYGISRFIFINKLDKEHAAFDQALATAKEAFGGGVLPLQFPVNEGVGFDTVVDLLLMKCLKFKKDRSGTAQISDIPADLKSKADGLREKLIEAAAESDDELLEIYFDKGTLTEEEFNRGLKHGIAQGSVFPVLCGSAGENMGVHQLLGALVDLAPSPLDRPGPVAKNVDTGEEVPLKCDPTASPNLFIFKTISEAHVGELSLFRVYSGVLKSGADLFNPNRDHGEKIGQIYLLNGKTRKEVGNVPCGDLGAVVKLKDSHTGDTLCDRKSSVVLPEIAFPVPVIRTAVIPKSKGDEERISSGLASLHEEDPTFLVHYDPELKQTIISGQGELHLAIIINRLKEKFGVDVTVEEPRIPYRETIQAASEKQYRHKKQTGGRGQFGEVFIRIEHSDRGEGFEFVNKITGGVIPTKFIPSVEKGIVEAMESGVLGGYPVVDLQVTLFDGKYHPVDSSDIAFKLAGLFAFKGAMKEAKPVLLEPIYDVEVTVPEEYMGDVMGDISSRRGKILGMDSEGKFQLIRAQVPLAELYKYSTSLRSMTAGRGIHRRKFSHYEIVPHEIADRIIAEAEKMKKES
ncbi:elongation factor G [candidate division KSB1 bacterium]|nr:elongation factor G [candidate division KSB1 bacterium]